ncbi:MAG: flavodoxin domain-containing protein [Spirochaetales bacterium]|uniref:Flavodoxin domain-containing protein n=1 Tax=Candidatus Thalassospirochaeta sargassi TaxID=3119039 RepID=A0AAJ1IDV2_9SPIO|nr:flavodoxin domain-containing protein [Spirochaetales bacterium]
MKIAVMYFTKSGNTRKVAEAIAKPLGVQAVSIDEGLKEDVDTLFLGSSVYAGGVDKKVKEFINGLNVEVKEAVNFSTAAIIKSTFDQMKKILSSKGIKMSDREFHCRGSFAVMHRNRPNADDLKKAEEFAKGFIQA